MCQTLVLRRETQRGEKAPFLAFLDLVGGWGGTTEGAKTTTSSKKSGKLHGALLCPAETMVNIVSCVIALWIIGESVEGMRNACSGWQKSV